MSLLQGKRTCVTWGGVGGMESFVFEVLMFTVSIHNWEKLNHTSIFSNQNTLELQKDKEFDL